MSEETRLKMKSNQTLFGKVIPQPLGKIISVALTKIRNAMLQETTHNGIQFYGDMED